VRDPFTGSCVPFSGRHDRAGAGGRRPTVRTVPPQPQARACPIGVEVCAIKCALARTIAQAPHDIPQRVVLGKFAPCSLVVATFGVKQPAPNVLPCGTSRVRDTRRLYHEPEVRKLTESLLRSRSSALASRHEPQVCAVLLAASIRCRCMVRIFHSESCQIREAVLTIGPFTKPAPASYGSHIRNTHLLAEHRRQFGPSAKAALFQTLR
jgi:hypothetical protein